MKRTSRMERTIVCTNCGFHAKAYEPIGNGANVDTPIFENNIVVVRAKVAFVQSEIVYYPATNAKRQTDTSRKSG